MKLQEYTESKYNFEECMKCTVCTAYCPVLQVNPLYPGPKQAGPDGERLRLKDPFFFNYALKYCMSCWLLFRCLLHLSCGGLSNRGDDLSGRFG